MTDESIFAEALAIGSPAERAAYLDRACAGNPALRAEVQALLDAHAASNPLDQPPADVARTGAYEPARAESPDEAIRSVLAGKYKLIELIGAGGMGAVYMAQQTEPVKRLVAVKVIRDGMDTRQVLARFEAERQALALMDHPNIAKVLDAGTTDRGQPFFVMELVKGVPITEFCDARKLSPRERLELFVPVCQAIQHAHQKGVIHRDIKPSNVLVALYDGRPVPKVIDFGVAKAAGQPLTDKTLVTGFGAIVGTPEYMSPEQAELNQLDIDTRSDVFALGVLLYELLTGTTPLNRSQLGKAALLEVLRIVREVEPPKPSTRVSTSGTLANIAANRNTDPVKLSKLMKGELDWIVMKALEKDRNRRYESATALAKDVERHLRGDAVEACPPTLGYRLRKAYKRNRAAVLTGAAFVGLLLVGLLVASFEFFRAEQERQRANAAEQSANANALRAMDAAEDAARAGRAVGVERDETKRQLARAVAAEADAEHALKRSEGLRLATTAVLKKPLGHDLAAALAHEAVALSPDAATTSAALSALQGLPHPRAFAAATVPNAQAPDQPFHFAPSEWFWFHPNGRRVLSLNSKHTAIATFDARTLAHLGTYRISAEEHSDLHQIVLDPRGRWFVTADGEGNLVARDADTGAEAGRAKWAGGVWELKFSAAGDRVAVVGPTGPREAVGDKAAPHRVAVYALPKMERLFEFEAPELYRTVALSRDGTKVAVSSGGTRVVRAWDVGTRAALLETEVPDKLPWPALVFAHDGAHLVDIGREGATAWDLKTKQKRLIVQPEKTKLQNGGTVTTDADGAVLLLHPTHVRRTLNSRAVVGDSSPVRTFDLKELKWGERLENEEGFHVHRCALSADGRRVVGLMNGPGIVVWDAATGHRLAQPTLAGDRADELAVAPDGSAFVSDGAYTLRMWDSTDRGILPTVEFQSAKYHALATSDGKRVVAIRGDGRLETFDAATLRTLDLSPPKRFPFRMDGQTLVRVLADGRRVLAVRTPDAEAVLYASDGSVIARFTNLPKMQFWNEARPTVLVAHRGGTRFLLPVAKGKGIAFRAYDAETGAPAGTVDLGDNVVAAWQYALSPDGKRLAIAPDRERNPSPRDTGAEVWNLDTGTRERKLPPGERHHEGGFAFDPTGGKLLTWYTGRVAIWDTATGEKLREFKLADQLFRDAALSADGSLIATSSTSELAVWRADTGANVYRLPQPDHPSARLEFAAGGAALIVDSVRRGWNALDLYPVDLAAHLKGLGVRRLDADERAEYGPFAPAGKPK